MWVVCRNLAILAKVEVMADGTAVSDSLDVFLPASVAVHIFMNHLLRFLLYGL